jgi:hypothetical protein
VFAHATGKQYSPHMPVNWEFTVCSGVCCVSYYYCLLSLLFDPEDGLSMFLRNVYRLLDVTAQNIVLLLVNAVRS